MRIMNTIKISIAGNLGGGKSTITQLMAKRLGCTQYSTGGIQREIAEKMGISTLELNELMKKDSDLDTQIDNFSRDLNDSDESFIIDSRMAWHFIPGSFKVFLIIDPDIAANRVIKDTQRKSEKYRDASEAKTYLLKRKQVEIERFRDLYNVDCSDMKNYDLVVDTSYSAPEAIADRILAQHEKWRKGLKNADTWMCPRRLFPTRPILQLDKAESRKIYNSIKNNGFSSENAVETMNDGEFFFILNGHARVSGAILNDVGLIPAAVVSGNAEGKYPGKTVSEFVESEFKMDYVHEWEERHGISFPSYPNFSGCVRISGAGS